VTTKKIVFAVNSYHQASQTIKSCKIYNIDPILYIKYFIINGFSPSWVEELNNLLINIFGKKKFEFCIDCRNNYSLFIDLAQKKIKYLKIKTNKKNYKKLKEIADKNKVLLNPRFSIVDLCKIKNIEKRISKIKN